MFNNYLMKIMQNRERSGTVVRTFGFSLTHYVIFEKIYLHLGVSGSLFLKIEKLI